MDITQNIVIKDRKSLTADAVSDIETFTDEQLILNTKYGKLCVEGKKLKILELTENDSKIAINGEIYGVYFVEEKEKKGFFKSIFR